QAQISAYPAPEGIQQIAYRDARLWVAQPAGDTTFIYRSKPFWYHLFDLFDYISIPGRVLMMLNIDQALIVATDTAIYAYSDESGLTQLAEYGVIPGHPGIVVDGRVVM